MRMAGFDTGHPQAGRAPYEDAGSPAWQRAQQMALQRNASQRRN